MSAPSTWCIVRTAPDGTFRALPSTFASRDEAQEFLDALQSNRRNGTEMVMQWEITPCTR